MYEVWISSVRSRKLIAKFRLLRDAKLFVSQHPEAGDLEISPSQKPKPAQKAKPPQKPSPKAPAASATRKKRRRASGICAVEHPEEFIADLEREA